MKKFKENIIIAVGSCGKDTKKTQTNKAIYYYAIINLIIFIILCYVFITIYGIRISDNNKN